MSAVYLIGMVYNLFKENIMAQYITLPDGSRCYSGPNCLRHGNKGLPADFSTKTVTEQLKDMEKLKNPLSSKEPKEIDTQISELYDKYYEVAVPLNVAVVNLERTERILEEMSETSRYYESTSRSIERLEEKISEYHKEANQILEEVVPYELEYKRRPWTRGFLVKNSNGHVHKNMNCRTCTPSTQYIWLTDYSGKDEATLVADAGKVACTACYPSAPVEGLSRESRIQDPVLRQRQQERENRALEKAQREEAKRAKALTAPDGSVLKDVIDMPIRTVSSAERVASDIQAELRAVREGIMPNHSPEYNAKKQRVYDNLMDALAVKKGIERERLEHDMKPKFERKFKSTWT
jgi:hypothetical protein